MRTFPIRLSPGQDLSQAIEAAVRTTAEALLALLPEWEPARGLDAVTGYDELVVRAVDVANGELKFGQDGITSLK